MSFSREVKEELSRLMPQARHCQIAETAALISMCGQISIFETAGGTAADSSGHPGAARRYFLRIQTENLTVARKYYMLLRKTFHVTAETAVRKKQTTGTRSYLVLVRSQAAVKSVLQTTRLLSADGEIRENLSAAGNLIIQNSCCKRAFIRGAFLAAGSVSDPEKSYHFEIAAASLPKAEQIRKLLQSFMIDAKIIRRKKYQVVYVKEGDQIVDALNVMGAHAALLAMENERVVKEVRNTINRQVNCEAANIGKTVQAAERQCEDIRLIRDQAGFASLPPKLEETARLRLAYPDISLKELGEMLDPPIGKSGVNHRLEKLMIIAGKLREGRSSGRSG